MTKTELRAEMGRAGGNARALSMSKKARKESAIKAAKARWAEKPKKMTDLQKTRAIRSEAQQIMDARKRTLRKDAQK